MRRAVDLADCHAVNPNALDVGHQALQSAPIRVAAGETGVVVARRNPALGAWLAT